VVKELVVEVVYGFQWEMKNVLVSQGNESP
jgi:hypothetical protein